MPRELAPAAVHTLIAEWQGRLGQFIADYGGGDPAVLSQLPALRSSAVLRPGQIVFAATDLETSVAERDGYDVFGLLVGKQQGANGPGYVFIVGVVERRDYRPVALVDVRVATMSIRGTVPAWETGSGDTRALARYRSAADASAALRFPADPDQFELISCAPADCVRERRSGALWMLAPVHGLATSDAAAARTSEAVRQPWGR